MMNHPNLKNPAVFPDLTLFLQSSNLPRRLVRVWLSFGSNAQIKVLDALLTINRGKKVQDTFNLCFDDLSRAHKTPYYMISSVGRLSFPVKNNF